jgi:hypothetical protein
MAAVESRLLAQCGFSGTSHFPGVALDSSTCQGLDIGGRRDERTWIHTLMERSAATCTQPMYKARMQTSIESPIPP